MRGHQTVIAPRHLLGRGTFVVFFAYATITLGMPAQGQEEGGDRAYVDRLVSLEVGNPPPKKGGFEGKGALGRPDWDGDDFSPTYVTLGCGGRLVVQFSDDEIFDGPGPDLRVYEIGPNIEAYSVEISSDLNVWYPVGESGGGKGDFDISTTAPRDRSYSFVRITDLREQCEGEWPGADLDAVATLHSKHQDPYADEVVSWTVGKPASNEGPSEASYALGPPDYGGNLIDPTIATLGCGGQITVKFSDNDLVDGGGADLRIFEAGNNEAIGVEISVDGTSWRDLGESRGGTTSFDIAPVASGNERFHFVRITDLKGSCKAARRPADVWLGKWSGASRYSETERVWEWWFTVSRSCDEYRIQTHTSGPEKVEILNISATELEFLFHDELGTHITISLVGSDTYAGTVVQPNNAGLPRGRVDGRRTDEAGASAPPEPRDAGLVEWDSKDTCDGARPGADIDAVQALNAPKREADTAPVAGARAPTLRFVVWDEDGYLLTYSIPEREPFWIEVLYGKEPEEDTKTVQLKAGEATVEVEVARTAEESTLYRSSAYYAKGRPEGAGQDGDGSKESE